MENLDSIKDVWKNQEESKIRFSESDINKMVQKKSSSIVKWILIISVLEFLLPNLLFLFTDFKSTRDFYAQYEMSNIMMFYLVVHIIIIAGFIYVFYKNYRNISVESTVKVLLQNILKTRRTVKNYIYYNLTMMGIIGLHMFYTVYSSETFKNRLNEESSMTMIWIVSIVFFFLAIFIFWLFYRLIYGFFLRKLNRNFKELSTNNNL